MSQTQESQSDYLAGYECVILFTTVIVFVVIRKPYSLTTVLCILILMNLVIRSKCFDNNFIVYAVCWGLSTISLMIVVLDTSPNNLTKVFGPISSLLYPFCSLSLFFAACIGQISMWYFEQDLTKVYSTAVFNCLFLGVLSHMFYCFVTSSWWNSHLLARSESYKRMKQSSFTKLGQRS